MSLPNAKPHISATYPTQERNPTMSRCDRCESNPCKRHCACSPDKEKVLHVKRSTKLTCSNVQVITCTTDVSNPITLTLPTSAPIGSVVTVNTTDAPAIVTPVPEPGGDGTPSVFVVPSYYTSRFTFVAGCPGEAPFWSADGGNSFQIFMAGRAFVNSGGKLAVFAGLGIESIATTLIEGARAWVITSTPSSLAKVSGALISQSSVNYITVAGPILPPDPAVLSSRFILPPVLIPVSSNVFKYQVTLLLVDNAGAPTDPPGNVVVAFELDLAGLSQFVSSS